MTELIELPVQYPTPRAGASHEPVLVTNGVISDDVRLSIHALNDSNLKRGHKPLQVICRDELRHYFVSAHGSYIPVELADMRSFLDLYNSNGRQNLQKAKFAAFLSSFFDSAQSYRLPDALRKITSAILLATYLLLQFSLEKNHVSLCEAWIILLSYILHFAHHHRLDKNHVTDTIALIFQSIETELNQLKAEVHARDANFIEGNPMGDGGLMYSIRLTIVLGWLCAYECVQSELDNTYVIDPQLPLLIEANLKYIGVWSEYAVPFMVAIYLLKKKAGARESAERMLADILRTVVSFNNGRMKGGFPDPYYTPDELLSSSYSVPGAEIDLTQFAGSSYTMRALVDCLVEVNRRDLVSPLWKLVIDTRSVEYYSEDPWDLLLWKSAKGSERDYGYDSPTSWGQLRASLPDTSELPTALSEYHSFAIYYSLTFPHRFRRDLLLLLNQSFAR